MLTCSRIVAKPEAISRLKDVLGKLGLASDIDDLSEYSSTKFDSDPNDRLRTIEQKGDDGSNYPGVMELSEIVDALFDLAPALDERIDQILEREKILEMRYDIPVDLRAIVVTVGSKFPQAPDEFVLVVARRILVNRNRLQGKPTEGVWEKQVAANPGIRQPNIRTPFSGAPSLGSFGQDSGPRSSLGSYEMSSGWDSGPRSQQTAQASVPSVPQPSVTRVDVSVTASSFASSMYSGNKNAKLVKMPARGSDGRIKCEICQQTLLIANDWSWKSFPGKRLTLLYLLTHYQKTHFRRQPYFCLDPDCAVPQASFKAKSLWKAHYEKLH